MVDAHCDDLSSLRERSAIAHIAQHVHLANYFAAKNRRIYLSIQITGRNDPASSTPANVPSGAVSGSTYERILSDGKTGSL